MSRRLRLCIEEATYHTYSRCYDWKPMIADDSFKELLISVLSRTQQKYSFDLVFYEILDNHIHLVIKTRKGEATISRIMQYIKSRFAEQFNKITGKIGPLWNERFKDVIVEQQENPLIYFFWLLWYLSYNSVRKGVVSDPRDYRYGSIHYYLRKNYKGKVKISIHEFYLGLGRTFSERVSAFIQYEKQYLLTNPHLNNLYPDIQLK